MFKKPETNAEAPIEIARYAVFGQPIAHSRSPLIHRMFAQAEHVVLRYDAIESSPADFPRSLAQFAADGGRGANITLPLKSVAHAACRTHGAHAQRSGVANTVTRREDGSWHGDNTDGIGLVADIAERLRLDLRGRRTLVLGAGVRCAQLTTDNRCAVFGDPARPAVCASLRPEPAMCGASAAEALANIAALEAATAPPFTRGGAG